MAKPPKDTIFAERQELMISPNGGTPISRKAHFLEPSGNSIDQQILKLPSLSLSSASVWPLKVIFNGWRGPNIKWQKWVEKLHPIYHNVWKEAGIYDAIMASTRKIIRNNDLVFGVAERWCSETSSFVFPWGETTITLEDMMVLGGFSVLGVPVFTPLENQEMVEIEENLLKARKFIIRSKSEKVRHSLWLEHFMESHGGLVEHEHEAFLALWLSRFVFPGNVSNNTINKDVFSAAIYLARGTRIALAPTVLATLYRDLGLLRETLSGVADLKIDKCDEDNYLALGLQSPLQLVQVWAWERFPPLQPIPKSMCLGEPRFARWDGVKGLTVKNLRWVLDSCAESFLWRPYAIAIDNWVLPKFYSEKEQCVLFYGEDFDEDLESFARCLRVSELVGIDSIETYLPHRVAMQFGMDQDLPEWIHRSNGNAETAWKNYTRPFVDAKMYVPFRLFESDATTRYMEWWKKSVLHPHCPVKGVVRRKRSSRKAKTLPLHFPPGFHPKSNWGKKKLRSLNKPSSEESNPLQAEKEFCDLPNSAGGTGTHQRMEMLAKQAEMNKLQGEAITKSETARGIANSHETKTESSSKNVASNEHEQEERDHFANELPDCEIELRLSKLERLVAELIAARYGCRSAEPAKTHI